MKNKLHIIPILLIFVNTTFAQTNSTPIGLDKKAFKTVLNQQFTSLITGQSKTSIGNFASLDLKESEVSFAGNSITKQGHVLGVKASGGVTDGLFSIFNNSTLNTKVSLEFQANFLNLKKQSLTWYDDSYQEYTKKKNDIEDKYRIKLIEVQNRLGLINLNYKKLKIEKTISELNKRLGTEKDQLAIDSGNYAVALNNSELSETNKLITNYPNSVTAKEDIDNWRAIELKKIKPELELYGFNFGWFSVNYKVSNNSFKLFNPNSAYQSQISDTSFVSHEVRLQYSKYNWTKEAYKTYFYSIGISFSLSDNFTDLTKKEITEVKNYGPNVNDRTTTKKYNAFVGDYSRKQKQVKLSADYYRFLFDNNVAAIHVYPEFTYKQSSKPLYNLGFGFLYAFKDSKKDDKSIVNVELFYNFIDIAKNTETDLKLFERNNIGIRFSFPINFINK